MSLYSTRPDGWAWVQGRRDGYVGYVEADALGDETARPTHMVSVPRTFVYPGPDLKFPRTASLSMGASVSVIDFVETRGTRYAIISPSEAIVASHLTPVDDHAPDFVTVAESLAGTPYLWGGSTAFRHRLLGRRPIVDAHGRPGCAAR